MSFIKLFIRTVPVVALAALTACGGGGGGDSNSSAAATPAAASNSTGTTAVAQPSTDAVAFNLDIQSGQWGGPNAFSSTDVVGAEPPKAASNEAGDAVVAWLKPVGFQLQVVARLYDRQQRVWGPEQVLVDRAEKYVKVGIDKKGNALVGWGVSDQDHSDGALYVRRYDAKRGCWCDDAQFVADGYPFDFAVDPDSGAAIGITYDPTGPQGNGYYAAQYDVAQNTWSVPHYLTYNLSGQGFQQYLGLGFAPGGVAMISFFYFFGAGPSEVQAWQYDLATNTWSDRIIITRVYEEPTANPSGSPIVAGPYTNSGLNSAAFAVGQDGVATFVLPIRNLPNPGATEIRYSLYACAPTSIRQVPGLNVDELFSDRDGNLVGFLVNPGTGTDSQIRATRYDVKTGTWALPLQVLNAALPGLRDVNENQSPNDFSVSFDNKGNAVAVWTRLEGPAPTTPTGSAPSSIASSRFDVKTGLWTEAQLIDNSNEQARGASVVTVKGDAAWAFWSQDQAGATKVFANKFE